MITATQALKTLNDEDQAAVMAGEKRIDAELSEYDGRPVRVNFANARSKVLARLCEMYREGGWYLERIYKWMARVGLDTIRVATVDDLDSRAALFARFVKSQETAQIDPWAERATGGVAAGEFAPMATLPMEVAAE